MTVEYAHGATVTSGTTASGESFRGEIFAYDADAGVLAVRTPGDVSNSFDVRFVNVDGATNVVVDASTAREPDAAPVADEPPDEPTMENALRCAKTAADNIGENVSALAQDVFDALARTLPCKWNGDVIVVMDEVEAPDRDDAGTWDGQTDGAAERVQKVPHSSAPSSDCRDATREIRSRFAFVLFLFFFCFASRCYGTFQILVEEAALDVALAPRTRRHSSSALIDACVRRAQNT